MKKIKALAALLILISVPFVISIFNKDSSVKVNVIEVNNGDITSNITSSCKFLYNKAIEVRSEVTGKVSEVFIKNGDAVDIGDHLFYIDDTELVLQVSQLSAGLNKAKLDFKAKEIEILSMQNKIDNRLKLLKKGMINQEEYDSMTFDMLLLKNNKKASYETIKEAEALLLKAQKKLKKSKVLSPIKGVVFNLNINAGELILGNSGFSEGLLALKIIDDTEVIAKLYVDEVDIPFVEVGQEVKIDPIFEIDNQINGMVSFIDNTIFKDSSNRTRYQVDVLLKPFKQIKKIKDSMSCMATITTEHQEGQIIIPLIGIIHEEDSSFVYSLDNNVLVKSEVHLGLSNDNYQVVLEGLTKGSLIVVDSANKMQKLKEGTKVIYDIIE